MELLQIQELLFQFQSSGIAGEFSAGADNPVAGDDDPDGIAVDSLTNGPGGLRTSDGSGDLTVGAGLPIGDCQQPVPDRNLEGRSFRGNGEIKALPASCQIFRVGL
mgnify:CR=1 FL=1